MNNERITNSGSLTHGRMERKQYLRSMRLCHIRLIQTGGDRHKGTAGQLIRLIDKPNCVKEALRKYVEFGVFGYYAPSQGYYDAFIS